MEVTRERPISAGVQALAHLVSAGQLAGVGLVAAAATALWARLGARSARLTDGAIALTGAGVAAALVLPDLAGLEGRLAHAIGLGAARALLVAGTGLGLACAARAGRGLSALGLSVAGALAGLALAIMNEVILRNDYPGAHLVMATLAATLLGAAIAPPAPIPANPTAPRASTAPANREATPGPTSLLRTWPRRRTLALVATALLSAWALVVPPPSAVARELLRLPGAVVAPVLARARAVEDPEPADVPGDPWYSRDGRSDVPPTTPRLVGDDAIVVLLVVDAFRADVASGARGARFPAMEALRDESVRFTHARSPASGTTWALASLFSGRTFSQLRWTYRRAPLRDGYYPHEDSSPRFPEVLAAAGIPTVLFTEMTDVLNEYGVVRGFTEERCLRTPESPSAQAVVSVAIERLGKQGPGPLFMYLHFLDAHAPYAGADIASPSGQPTSGSGDFDRYLAALAAVDRAIGRLRRALSSAGLAPRVTYVLTADHGEAFGEHGVTHHAVSVYDELLRVPLWISTPGATPRSVDEDVSLLDLGPTILDLFGHTTPATFLGQSLLARLRDAPPPSLSRPIVADTGRWQQAMIFPDHWKILRDRRRGTLELYDLGSDPGETVDLLETAADADARLTRLRAFFGVHAFRDEGYSAPFRP